MSTAGRVDGLDAIRAVAIALVVASHLELSQVPGGDMGVHMFFALSGFLITSLLLREHRSFGRVDLRAFYIRRALRLVPALAVVIVAATGLALAWHYSHAWLDALAAATYTTNLYFMIGGQHANTLGHAWSLAAEEQFYLLWPPVLVGLLLARRRSPVALILAAIVIGVALSAVLVASYSRNAAYLAPPTSMPVLMAGALAAVLLDRGLPAWAQRAVRSWAAPVVAGIVLLALARQPMWESAWSYRGGWLLVGVATAVLALHLVLARESVVSRALSLAPIVWVGRRSYAIYLWHVPLLGLAARIGWHSRFLTVALSLVAAELSWRLVEAPALRRKRRFERVTLRGPLEAGGERAQQLPAAASA